MAKGYIVVDMPDSCENCKFCHIYDEPYCLGCVITDMTHAGWDKPDWCPIKEIPDNLKENKLNTELVDFMRGWNEMIDEMFGDET